MWINADAAGRRAITAASRRIELKLTRAADPRSVGVPYPAGRLPTARRVDDPQLSAVFVFMPSFGEVHVLDFLRPGGP